MIDNREIFWTGLQEGKLLYQHCVGCGVSRFPFHMSCANCGSVECDIRQSRGLGTIISHTTVTHPLPPGADQPYTVVLVEMAEAVRYLGLLESSTDEALIGTRVAATVDTDQFVPIRFSTISTHGRQDG